MRTHSALATLLLAVVVGFAGCHGQYPDPVDPTDPPTDPTDPMDPPTDPTDPTDPMDPPTDPTDPMDPPTDPMDPPTDPMDPPTDPMDPPTDPMDPPTDPPTTVGEVSAATVLFVGHSLIGWDMPSMLDDLAADGGRTHAWDAQIGNGGTIQLQWMRAAEGVNAREALRTGRYDVFVTTEAIPLESNYLWSGTVEFAGNFYDLAQSSHPGTRFYIYETWHSREDPSWRPRIDTDRALWERIVDEIDAAHEGPEVLLLPGGTALAALVDRIQAGTMPGIRSVDQLFTDDIHMSALGWYFIACVQYATIYRKSPVGLTNATFDRWDGAFPAPSPETARAMQEIAWDVVSRDPRAGVAE